MENRQDENNNPEINTQEDHRRMLEDTVGQVKKEIIDHYDKIQSEIDIRTEQLLSSLPEALKTGKEELLERVKEERDKCLAALAPDSPLVRFKNEYYTKFTQLRDEYNSAGNDNAKKQEIEKKLEDLKKEVQILEDFLEDFQNRTLIFEEADKSVYASLIGELVSINELNPPNAEQATVS